MSKRFGRNKRRKARFDAELFCKKLEAIGKGIVDAILEEAPAQEPPPPPPPAVWCFYDNPISECREEWVNKKIRKAVSREDIFPYVPDGDTYKTMTISERLRSAMWSTVNERHPDFVPGKVLLGDKSAILSDCFYAI